MKAIVKYLSLLILAATAVSCSKVIDLKLGNETGLLVIDANITRNIGPQIIKLSLNVPFANTNTYPPVTGASVIVNDQAGNKRVFTEISPGTYSAVNFDGIPKYTYTLNVITGGKTYTATSTMPKEVALDSIDVSQSDFDAKKKKVTAYFQDPQNDVNQYKFVMTVNDVQVKRVMVTNDDFNNGKYVSFDLWQNDININIGDKITVYMECVDKPMYTYWFTLMQQENSGPGGGVTPSNPPTNITPATLGYFSAHTMRSKTVTVH